MSIFCFGNFRCLGLLLIDYKSLHYIYYTFKRIGFLCFFFSILNHKKEVTAKLITEFEINSYCS